MNGDPDVVEVMKLLTIISFFHCESVSEQYTTFDFIYFISEYSACDRHISDVKILI